MNRLLCLLFVLAALLLLGAPSIPAQRFFPSPSSSTSPARIALTRVLFLYGSVPPGTDPNDMVRINNTGPNGYAELAKLLSVERGHNLTELQDTDPQVNPLTFNVLSPYNVLVLGSNNRRFSPAEVAVVAAYVSAGGSIFAFSDSRFGLSPDRSTNALGAGELSDNDLLAQFGFHIEHDNYQVVVADRDRFLQPTHPILAGLNSFKGEGVSPIRISAPAQILVRGDGLLLTDGHTITGPDYAITAIAQPGRGRIAVTFDRNTFFNSGAGSAGTDLDELNNRQYALNLLNWLARP